MIKHSRAFTRVAYQNTCSLFTMPLPPSTKSINGVETTVTMLSYADRLLFVVTQLGKVGNLVRPFHSQTASTNTNVRLLATSFNPSNSTPASTLVVGGRRTSHRTVTSHRSDATVWQCSDSAHGYIIFAICDPHRDPPVDTECTTGQWRGSTERRSRTCAQKISGCFRR